MGLHPLLLLKKSFSAFRQNRGFLLAGAVAYNALLSLVPMMALILVILSQLFETQPLIETLAESLKHFAPNQVEIIIKQLVYFIDNWKLIGILGVISLLLFSTFAFSVLEGAMQVIFHRRSRVNPRHIMISAGLPYLYIVALAVGLVLLTALASVFQSLPDTTYSGVSLYLLGVLGEVVILTSFYKILPAGKLAWSHAVIGGVTATTLWEISRTILVWYLSTLSVVNIVYGTFATTIVILLCFEVAAIILLFGAQIIAEYEYELDGHYMEDF